MLDATAECMGLSIDQAIQIASAVGTWLAAFGTVGAVIVALWLARSGQKVSLKARVGIRHIMGGGHSRECLSFRVTNLGDRPVTIEGVGWRVGRGKSREFADQMMSFSLGDQFPKRLEHGASASFILDFSESPAWKTDFFEKVIGNRPLKTLRAQIYTSVGHTEVVRPEVSLLKRLKKN